MSSPALSLGVSRGVLLTHSVNSNQPRPQSNLRGPEARDKSADTIRKKVHHAYNVSNAMRCRTRAHRSLQYSVYTCPRSRSG
ncbi:hypothetical protein BJY04DRAFT_22835 [Aspergillus karnatakaensis]|uniref:uncharacterized protein n=1 Tax=Aspergillus karnatakaensis TaxID=1810916 RepID=UPI003CCE4327